MGAENLEPTGIRFPERPARSPQLYVLRTRMVNTSISDWPPPSCCSRFSMPVNREAEVYLSSRIPVQSKVQFFSVAFSAT